ncbi:MAG: DoxX family protein [Bryobacteraceae bacterium]|nr:DoxX family protein [Bryobacteraceae bacterium]
MANSMAQPRLHSAPLVLPAWKSLLSIACAVLLAVVFLVAGLWKLTEPYEAASRMIQAKVPAQLGLFTAISFGIAESFAAVLLLVPRFRRWGAILTGLMLLAFMAYIGFHYNALRGEECSCFPWLKRAIGPGFFVGDMVLLLMALAAGVWSNATESIRGAAIVLAAICVFAMASFGITYARQSGASAPDTIVVDGSPYSLQFGKKLLYFFDPECTHCLDAAKKFSSYRWTTDTAFIGVPTVNPRFAPTFIKDSGLAGKSKLSNDLDKLKAAFPFTNGPFAVAIENGRQKQSFIQFEGSEPETSLRKLRFIE